MERREIGEVEVQEKKKLVRKPVKTVRPEDLPTTKP